MVLNKIYYIDALEGLKQLDDESIDCIVTSPPYWKLRDYGVEGQLGQENHFNEYIEKLLIIFNECKRVLKKSGTCWVNIGDTYSSNSSYSKGGRAGYERKEGMFKHKPLQEKSLCLIPQRFSIAMVDNGWICRNEIIWHKRNCIPSSVRDRFTVDFEHLFFFVKSKKYWFEKQLEEYTNPLNRWGGDELKATNKSFWDKNTGQIFYRERNMRPNPLGRNKRCVWSINTKPFPDAHFAVFPTELIEIPIKAGCPEKGIVLDPFMGSGTTALVTKQQNKNYMGFELNPEYIKIAEKRLKSVQLNLNMEVRC